MINFGKYDQKVSFVTYGQVSDGYGGYVPSETTVISTFASVRQLKGYSDIEQAQLTLPNTYVVYIQQRSSFSPTTSMKIKYRGNVLAINSVEQTTERGALEWKFIAVKQ